MLTLMPGFYCTPVRPTEGDHPQDPGILTSSTVVCIVFKRSNATNFVSLTASTAALIRQGSPPTACKWTIQTPYQFLIAWQIRAHAHPVPRRNNAHSKTKRTDRRPSLAAVVLHLAGNAMSRGCCCCCSGLTAPLLLPLVRYDEATARLKPHATES